MHGLFFRKIKKMLQFQSILDDANRKPTKYESANVVNFMKDQSNHG